MNAPKRPSLVRTALIGALLLLAGTTLASAWLCDDAFITFRTVENVVDGHGARWNVTERVQAYTHPLWMLLLTAVRAVTGEIVVSSMIVSLLVTWTAVVLLVGGARERSWLTVVLVGGLALSRSFVDYSTSGLENPLVHLLVVVLLREWWSERRSPLRITAIVSALLLCRLDLAMLIAPLLVTLLWQRRDRRTLGAMVLGAIPLIAWEFFSIIYYGVPFPNTAYAKLGAGLPAGEYVTRGFTYLGASAAFDPLAAVLIVGGMAVAAARRRPSELVVAVGVLLYLGYVVRIGGDFMAGRFLTVPLLVAVALLLRVPSPGPRPTAVAAAAVVGLAFLAPDPVLTTGPSFAPERDTIVGDHGVADERGIYYRSTGWFRDGRGRHAVDHPWATQGRRARLAGTDVAPRRTIGFFGFFAGPGVHVVDRFGLADPLLARLPADVGDDWRVGHLERPLPRGYLGSVRSWRTGVADPDVAALDRTVRAVTRGRLFAPERWRAIVDLNFP